MDALISGGVYAQFGTLSKKVLLGILMMESLPAFGKIFGYKVSVILKHPP